MRFMILRKADKKTEAGVLPCEKLLAVMGQYMEDMAKAGVLLSGEGLQPSSKGARVKFSGGKPTVIDGRFAETQELIGGFCLIEVKSKQEAIDWISAGPPSMAMAKWKSRFGKCSRPRTSVPSSLPSSGNRRSFCAHKWKSERRRNSRPAKDKI